jgi:hypothetical protein
MLRLWYYSTAFDPGSLIFIYHKFPIFLPVESIIFVLHTAQVITTDMACIL